jgi:hypothetical protein
VRVLAAVLLAGCLPAPVHRCLDDADCADGAVCREAGAPGSDDRRCADADAACPLGRRWADGAGELAGTCLAAYRPDGWSPCLVHAPLAADDPCAVAVCAREPRCCEREWSDDCAHLADATCGTACGAVAAFLGEGFLEVAAWDGAGFATFWEAELPGEVVNAAGWGDFDGDGLPDLGTCDDGSLPTGAVRIWHNTGDDFALVHEGEAGFLCHDLDWVDVDDDGDLDVLTTGAYTMAITEHRGGAGFEGPVSAFQDGYLAESDWADLDGDGLLDVATARYDLDFHVLGNSLDDFAPIYDAPDLADDSTFKSISWGDVDGDGALDLLVSGYLQMALIASTDAAGFAPGASLLELPGREVGDTLLADLDDDGDRDVAALVIEEPIEVYANLGDDGFDDDPSWASEDVAFDAVAQDGQLVAGDLDGDRRLDLVACGRFDWCRAWVGHGDGSFARAWDPEELRPVRDVQLTGDWR